MHTAQVCMLPWTLLQAPVLMASMAEEEFLSSERLILEETSEEMERVLGFLGLRVEEEGMGSRAGAGGIFIRKGRD